MSGAGTFPNGHARPWPTRESVAAALVRESDDNPDSLVPQFVIAEWIRVPLVIANAHGFADPVTLRVVATVSAARLPDLALAEQAGRVTVEAVGADPPVRGSIVVTRVLRVQVPTALQRALLPLLVHDHRPVRVWALAALGG